jgi:peptide/nickel transport system permease protein
MILSTLLLGGLLGATLVRLSPGYGVNEQELDTRLSQESLQVLRQKREGEGNILRFYAHYLADLLRGDLGTSQSLGQPLVELFADRIPVTFRSVGIGLAIGWLLGLALALPTTVIKSPAYEIFSTVLSGFFLCLPVAALALMFLFIDGPSPLAIGLVIFPRVFRFVRNLLMTTQNIPHVLAAKARGLKEARILWWHTVTPVIPQILALAGVSVSMGFGAAIPVEVVCDSPGLGQLAWQAALGRDLPLLVDLTLLVTLVTLLANLGSDLANLASGSQQP